MNPSPTPDRAARIRAVLDARFSPLALDVTDDSAAHAGHAGARAGGETHYTVRMTAVLFEGLSRVNRQRLVHEALAAEFTGGLHALSLVLRAPSEGLRETG